MHCATPRAAEPWIVAVPKADHDDRCALGLHAELVPAVDRPTLRVLATVVAKMPYGLRVRVSSGEIGVVDRVLIHDLPLREAEWPSVGAEILVVCGGYTSGGQLRLSARESDIDIAKTKVKGCPGEA